MKNFWIPSGVAYFPGNYLDLLRIIGNMGGTLEDENTFRCTLTFPRRNYARVSVVRVRGHISFSFRCSIERRDDSCKITYKVYPTFTSAVFLLLPIYIFLSSLLNTNPQERIENFFSGIFLGCVLVGLFLLARRFCIRQFVRKFAGEDESNFS